MVRILANGDAHFLETIDGRRIGWISDRSIGFSGFASHEDAIAWAIEGWSTLQSVLERTYTGWPRKELAAADARVEDGVITDGATSIARLVASRDADQSGYAIEFDLPTYATEGVAVAAANRLGRARIESEAAA